MDMNISHLPIHKNISQNTLNIAGQMYYYFFNVPTKRGSDWYTFYTRLYLLHSLRKILLAISSMNAINIENKCSDFCRLDEERKMAMIEAVGEVLNLTFRDIGTDRMIQNRSKGM